MTSTEAADVPTFRSEYNYVSHGQPTVTQGRFATVADAHTHAKRTLPARATYSVWVTTGEHTGQHVEDGKVPG